jgi:hypothetical protein
MTNIDYKTKGEIDKYQKFNGSLQFASFGTMGRNSYSRLPTDISFKEQVAQSGGWLKSKNHSALKNNPRFETSMQFY